MLDHQKSEFQKNIYFWFIDYAKAFDCVDHNKLWKIPASWEICMQVRKQQLELDMEQQTGLDSMLKSRDITLPMKVRLVKAMVFPVVMYGC